MPKYSMPFIAKIYRFLRVCLEMNELEDKKDPNQNYTYNYAQNSCKIYYNSPNYYKIEIEKLYQTSDVLLRYIYQKSIKENYYFFDCPSQVYINHFENRREIFLNRYIDSSGTDFIQSELHNLQNPKQSQIITIKYKCINKFLAKKKKELINFDHLRFNQNSGASIICFNKKSATINYSQLVKTDNTWKYSHQKKIIFLKEKLNNLKYNSEMVTITANEVKPKYQITVNQTVILLDSLGIFSHPTMENISLNKQSDLISSITKRNSKNIKTFISKLNKSPSNNGEQYLKDFNKVEQLLVNLKK